MISSAFNAAVYDPLYNGLVYIVGALPSYDVGIAVIILTIIVRVILYPLSKKAIVAQIKMKKIAPEIELLKEKYKNDREQQGKAMFALYKEKDIHPFASFGLVLIQLPILFALYWVFAWGGLPSIDVTKLYAFVHQPAGVNMEFIGLINMAGKSMVLAVLAAATQVIYTRLSMGPRKKSAPTGRLQANQQIRGLASPPQPASSFAGDMARSFDLQARYVLPIFIGVVAYTVPSAAALYWVTSNTSMIAQELLMGRRFRE
ncbi:MAG: YidC/Oxa1 family membrane protein insertase [bacterium]|nr:YidC/Oxa1 family membrane protein insertase [bacterium]